MFELTLYLILSLLIDDHDGPNPGSLPSPKLLPLEAVINEAAYTDAGITDAAEANATSDETATTEAAFAKTAAAEASTDQADLAEGAPGSCHH